MKNIESYENFSLSPIAESCSACSAMTHDAKKALENLCQEILCREAHDYHNDPDESHTYEGYVNECAQYLKEMMGQPGYQSLTKTYAE